MAPRVYKRVVSAANSLVGSTDGDQIGWCGFLLDHCVTALNNGNYVVQSPHWHNLGLADAGAVTWGDGVTGVSGAVFPGNSLVGSTAGDKLGCLDQDCYNVSVTALNNGNYVVASPYWDNGVMADAGAATWGNGATGVSGAVSPGNSLVGSTAGDQVGSGGVTALGNGYYLVVSSTWSNESTSGAGAVTWVNGAAGVSGAVSATNSLVGSTAGDFVGNGGVRALGNGDYVVKSLWWHNGATPGAGAITFGVGAACAAGPTAAIGPITAANSVLGATANSGDTMNFAYDPIHNQLVVGRPADNIVTLFAFECVQFSHWVYLPAIAR